MQARGVQGKHEETRHSEDRGRAAEYMLNAISKLLRVVILTRVSKPQDLYRFWAHKPDLLSIGVPADSDSRLRVQAHESMETIVMIRARFSQLNFQSFTALPLPLLVTSFALEAVRAASP